MTEIKLHWNMIHPSECKDYNKKGTFSIDDLEYNRIDRSQCCKRCLRKIGY